MLGRALSSTRTNLVIATCGALQWDDSCELACERPTCDVRFDNRDVGILVGRLPSVGSAHNAQPPIANSPRTAPLPEICDKNSRNASGWRPQGWGSLVVRGEAGVALGATSSSGVPGGEGQADERTRKKLHEYPHLQVSIQFPHKSGADHCLVILLSWSVRSVVGDEAGQLHVESRSQ